MLFKEMLTITFSRQASGSDSFARRTKLIKFAAMGTIAFAFIIGVYWLTADVFFSILFPKYAGTQAVWLSKIAFATLIVIPWNLIPQYLEAHGATVPVRNSNLYSSAIFLACLLLLVPEYRLLGAIVSRGSFRVSYIVISVWYLYQSSLFVPND